MSDILTDEEQVARLKAWWDENGLMLVGAVVIGIAGVVGWRFYDSARSESIATAANLYADYLAAAEADRDAAAQRLIEEIPESAYATLVLLRSAAQAVEAEDFEAAEGQLTDALAAAQTTTLKDLVRMRLARVQQQLDRADAALATLSEIRGSGFRPLAAELKGDIHLARGERAAAHEAYSSALAELSEGTQRALLELKAADTADAVDA